MITCNGSITDISFRVVDVVISIASVTLFKEKWNEVFDIGASLPLCCSVEAAEARPSF